MSDRAGNQEGGGKTVPTIAQRKHHQTITHSSGPLSRVARYCCLGGGGRAEFHHPDHDHLYRQVPWGPFSSLGVVHPAVLRPQFLLLEVFNLPPQTSLSSVGHFRYRTFRAATVLCSSASITLETENRTVPRESLTKGILPSFCHARIVRTETLNSDASAAAVISCRCSLVSFIVWESSLIT